MGSKSLRFSPLFFLFFALSSFGSRWAEAENCYYHLEQGGIRQIEKVTEKETFLRLKGEFHSIYCHKGSLYLGQFWGALHSYDFNSGDTTQRYCKEDRENNLFKYYFWDEHAFVSNYSGGRIVKVPLDLKKEKETLELGRWIKRGYIHGDLGCFALERSDEVAIVDLKTFTVNAKISVGRSPKHMVGVGDKLYVSCQESERVGCIDLNKLECVSYINVERLPRNLIVSGDHLYVFNVLSQTISDVDLKTHAVLKTISLSVNGESCLGHPLFVRNNIGYVTRKSGKEVLMINMVQGTILSTTKCDTGGMVVRSFMTDRAFFINGQRVCSLFGEIDVFLNQDLRLFSGFLEVEGLSFDDGESDYTQMLAEIQEGHFDKARDHLINALCSANPKAYAVAAYACLHGVWGCTPHLGLHVEYAKSADPKVYKQLCDLFQDAGEEKKAERAPERGHWERAESPIPGWEGFFWGDPF